MQVQRPRKGGFLASPCSTSSAWPLKRGAKLGNVDGTNHYVLFLYKEADPLDIHYDAPTATALPKKV